MAPRVSVILPFRDAAETIEAALDSILSQTGVSFEVIAVNDGSRDEGPKLLSALAARHENLHLFHTQGVGIAAALNQATHHAQGSYLARMDADDLARPGRLVTQCAYLDRHDRVGAVGTQVEVFPDDVVQDGLRHYVHWQNGLLTDSQHHHQLFVESPLCHPSVMLRKAAWTDVGGYRQGDFPEDYDLWLRLDAAGYRLAKLEGIYLRWRCHERQATRTDPRYRRTRFLETKAPHLARRLLAASRPVEVWGAGQTGKRVARAVEPYGVRAERFIDIDPKKIGRKARGVPIVGVDELRPPGASMVVVAVGARGARDLVRDRLHALGYQEGQDYLCAS